MRYLLVPTDQTLSKRIDKAKVEKDRTAQYLEELEKSIPDAELAKWRTLEAEWKENVEHLEQEGSDFDSPYELKAHHSMCCQRALFLPESHTMLEFSPKELIATLAERRKQSGESAASLLGVIEWGIELQEERSGYTRLQTCFSS